MDYDINKIICKIGILFLTKIPVKKREKAPQTISTIMHHTNKTKEDKSSSSI